uniref:Matrix metallopeptidase 25 n=1 Tax=Marmota marmota marmota TaxID=9994 RepID=A0A8C5Z364_MARMA
LWAPDLLPQVPERPGSGLLRAPWLPWLKRAMRPLALGLRFLTPLLLLARSAPASEPSAQDVSLGVVSRGPRSPGILREAGRGKPRSWTFGFGGWRGQIKMSEETLETMRKPRCSLPDVLGPAGLVRRRRRYALSGSVWRKRILTWRVQSFPQSSLLNPQIVRTLMSYALTVWGVESGLTFQEVNSQHQEADILIDFARAYHQDSYPFDGLGGTLAHAFFPGEHPISGDTHFDDEEIWTFGSQDGEGTDLFAVAVHEFGHALGLGHSSAPNSIMRPFYQGPVGDPDKYRLSQDDRDGLQQLCSVVALPCPPSAHSPFLPSPSAPVPDRCEGSFDAIANIRGETFFFKGPWFWRLQPSGQLVSPRPARVHRFWEGLPSHVRVIQAAYARRGDGRILLFSGPQFWVFRERQLEGAARPLEELGLPPGEEVDAVFSWPFNGKTYLIRGQQYWRYDEAAARPDPGYPRDLSLWEGAPPAPDDVTVGNTGPGTQGRGLAVAGARGTPGEAGGARLGAGLDQRLKGLLRPWPHGPTPAPGRSYLPVTQQLHQKLLWSRARCRSLQAPGQHSTRNTTSLGCLPSPELWSFPPASQVHTVIYVFILHAGDQTLGLAKHISVLSHTLSSSAPLSQVGGW